jgi:hypothetical protein
MAGRDSVPSLFEDEAREVTHLGCCGQGVVSHLTNRAAVVDDVEHRQFRRVLNDRVRKPLEKGGALERRQCPPDGEGLARRVDGIVDVDRFTLGKAREELTGSRVDALEVLPASRSPLDKPLSN